MKGERFMEEVATWAELQALVKRHGKCAVNFYAPWAEPCHQMNDVFATVARVHGSEQIKFITMNAEANPKAMSALHVSSVPTFLMLKSAGPGKAGLVEQGRVEGADAPGLNRAVLRFLEDKADESLNEKLKRLIGTEVKLFMKGNPGGPQCKFSRAIVGILNAEGVSYDHFDIFTDEEVRQGLKDYSNWPTFPQLYAYGSFIGGEDVVRELVQAGELQNELARAAAAADAANAVTAAGDPQPAAAIESLEERLTKLVAREKVMLFMKGTPDRPRCGFSKKIVCILNEAGVKYGSFDILEDEEVRQGLKKQFNWPTFPQLYSSGQLIGGVDVIQELRDMGELKDELQ